MNIYITVEGPVYITAAPGTGTPGLNATLGAVALKKDAKMPQEGSMTTEQRIQAAIDPKTQAGNPATLDGPPTWTVESGDCTVDPIDDKHAWINAGAALGDSVVVVKADADLGSGVTELADSFLIHVNHAGAADLGASLGTPELKPTP